MPPFQIDPDISLAHTLNTDFYTDPVFFEESRAKIFAKSWQYIGDAGMVSEKGRCVPFTLLENYLDEPLLLTRDAGGQIHCLSNVCTHRGTVLVGEACTSANLRCRYHGRQFRLDGQFVSMPEFKEVKNFPTAEDNLTRLPLFEWGPCLFTSLDVKAVPEKSFQDMLDRLAWLPFHEFIFKPELSAHYTVQSHWALYCENYLEGFHIPFVHAGLNAMIDFGNYTTELFEHSNLQLGLAKTEDQVFDLPESSPDYGKKISAYYYWLFPNMMFNFYPWGLSINVVRPLGPDITKVSFIPYVWDESKFDRGAGSGLDRVEREDEAIVEAVQRGVRSRFYDRGRYSVAREQNVWHFHRLLAEGMGS